MLRRPPRSTRTDTLFPYPTLFRSESILSSTIAAANGNDENASAYSTCHPARLCPMIPTRWRSTNPAEHRSSIAASYPCILTFARSEEHTSELQSLMRISYAVFCLKKKQPKTNNTNNDYYINT